MTDYLACPQCGEWRTDGEFCNLTCRRAWLTKINQMWRDLGRKPLTIITAQDAHRLCAEYEEYQRTMLQMAFTEMKVERFLVELQHHAG